MFSGWQEGPPQESGSLCAGAFPGLTYPRHISAVWAHARLEGQMLVLSSPCQCIPGRVCPAEVLGR